MSRDWSAVRSFETSGGTSLACVAVRCGDDANFGAGIDEVPDSCTSIHDVEE